MTRVCIPFIGIVSLSASGALAHPGHIEEVAGHSHWLGYGAAVLAVLIGVGLVVLGYRRIVHSNR